MVVFEGISPFAIVPERSAAVKKKRTRKPVKPPNAQIRRPKSVQGSRVIKNKNRISNDKDIVVEGAVKDEIEFQQRAVYELRRKYDEMQHEFSMYEKQYENIKGKLANLQQENATEDSVKEKNPNHDHEIKIVALKQAILAADKYGQTLGHMKYRLEQQTNVIVSKLSVHEVSMTTLTTEAGLVAIALRTTENDIAVLDNRIQNEIENLKEDKLLQNQELGVMKDELKEREIMIRKREAFDQSRCNLVKKVQNPSVKLAQQAVRKKMQVLSLNARLNAQSPLLQKFNDEYNRLVSATGESDVSSIVDRMLRFSTTEANLTKLLNESNAKLLNLEKEMMAVQKMKTAFGSEIQSNMQTQGRIRDEHEESLRFQMLASHDNQDKYFKEKHDFKMIEEGVNNLHKLLRSASTSSTSIEMEDNATLEATVNRCQQVVQDLLGIELSHGASFITNELENLLPRPTLDHLHQHVIHTHIYDDKVLLPVRYDDEKDEGDDILIRKMLELNQSQCKEKDGTDKANEVRMQQPAEDIGPPRDLELLEVKEKILYLKENPISRSDIKARSDATQNRVERLQKQNAHLNERRTGHRPSMLDDVPTIAYNMKGSNEADDNTEIKVQMKMHYAKQKSCHRASVMQNRLSQFHREMSSSNDLLSANDNLKDLSISRRRKSSMSYTARRRLSSCAESNRN